MEAVTKALMDLVVAVAKAGGAGDDVWDAIATLEGFAYPESFAPHPDADPFCELCATVYPKGEAHECYDPERDEPGCECEQDWKCGVCRLNGYRHSILDAGGPVSGPLAEPF